MASVQRIALAYNNIYVVDDGPGRVLIDTGPDYRGAFELARGAIGARLPSLVVATHGHLDHAGLGARWQEAGVPVMVAHDDAHLVRGAQLQGDGDFLAFVAFVAGSGAPPEVVAEVTEGLEQRRGWSRRAAAEREYPESRPRDRWPSGLRFQTFEPALSFNSDRAAIEAGLTLTASPGHTPGNLVTIHEGEGWLFSGDQLLPEITPTPAIQPLPPEQRGADWRFRSLPAFLSSLSRLAGLGLTRCYPGHGEPFDDVDSAIAANIGAIEQRTARVEAELHAAGRVTLYALSERLYPRAVRRRFWQIVATVQGHLDHLEANGRATFRAGHYEPRSD